jgi:hypothetical protein
VSATSPFRDFRKIGREQGRGRGKKTEDQETEVGESLMGR